MAENWTNLRMRKKLWKRLEKEAELEHRSVASLVEKLLSDVITSIEEQRKVG
jgi:predicted HicB family RNase H-like nuclease